MRFAGLQKMTLLDYPGRVACTVFTPGCNLRCPFCHNAMLVLPGEETPLLEEEEIPALMSRLLGDLSRRQQLLRDPFMVRGIRPYQPGDPVRDIHWPATAKTGETQVRIHDYTTRTRLLVVLNVQAEDVQWSNQLPEDADAAMEYGTACAILYPLSAFLQNRRWVKSQGIKTEVRCDFEGFEGDISYDLILRIFVGNFIPIGLRLLIDLWKEGKAHEGK